MIGRKSGIFLIAIIALLALAFFVRPGEAQKRNGRQADAPPTASAKLRLTQPVVGQAVRVAETVAMREVGGVDETDAESEREAREINKLNRSIIRTARSDAKGQKDGALHASWTPADGFQLNIPSPILTFEGGAVQNTAPPDTTGAVGPNDYVQSVNSTLVRVFDKNGVPRVPIGFSMNAVFAPLGGVCATNNQGDPIVLYDRIANRWVLSQFAFASITSPPYHQCVAVSKTGDPLGEYWAYDFITPGAEFPDYPKFGVWPDGYYFTDRQFTNGAGYNGFGVFAFDRAKMLVGDSTASFIYFNAGPNLSQSSSGMLPTDYYGLTPPPAGAPNLFSVFVDDIFDGIPDALRLFDFHADFAFPGNSTFIERAESPLAVASFDSRTPHTQTAGRNDIEQPPPALVTDYLNVIGDRLMSRIFYINLAGNEQVTTVHSVNAGTIPAGSGDPTIAQYRAATRHYVLQKTSPGGAWSVLDQATFAPADTLERWMGCSALDNAGNLAVGYSTSDLTTFPSIAWSGRLATDPPNTLGQGEALMFAGTAVQQVTGNRWGDYSNMSLDPSDDATFWYTNQYYNVTGQFLWRTRVGKFKYPGTTAPAQGTLSGTITACDSGVPLKDALVQVSGGPSTGFSSASMPNGTYSMNLSPGNYSVTVVDPAHGCTAIGPFNVTITNGATTTLNQCLTGSPTFIFQSSAVLVSGGDGDGAIEPNECNNVNVSILNNGCLIGANVSAVLSTTTPGVTVTQPNSPYPNANESAPATNTVPFAVSTSNAFVSGTPISLTLTVSFSGGTSSFPFTVSTSVPPVTINGSLDAGDPVQEGRLGRNGAVSGCGTAKPCPLIFGAGNRRYDVHTFPNGPAAACATITTTSSAAVGPTILPVAYLNAYTPPGVGTGANICINYLGDPGASAASTTFSVNVPANQTLIVVVQETNAGQVPPAAYSVQVSGLVGTGAGPGPCAPAPSVVSRKMHGAFGPFDIPLPLTGPVGVEDRTGNGGVAGNHTIVLSFTSDPTGATASVAANNPSGATGNVSGVSYSGNDMIVNLTGVSNKQVLTLSTSGGSVSPAVVPIGFLVGDVTGNGSVNAGDIGQTKSQSGNPAGAGNFRADVTVNGDINAGDIGLVKSSSGNTLP